jgi:hypothetical protein
MKDVYAVLRQKEAEIMRVRREIEALRAVVPLLSDDSSQVAAAAGTASRPQAKNKWPLEVREVR